MNKELSKNLVCLLVRGGIEIWIEQDRAENLKKLLFQQNCPQFIEYNGEIINKADITGIFTAQIMEDKTRRKNGEWKCKFSNWHDKKEDCRCITAKRLKESEKERNDFFEIRGYYPPR